MKTKKNQVTIRWQCKMSDDDSTPQINLIRMGEHDVVPLDNILRSLNIMADNIRNESCLEEIKNQLKSRSYDNWFGENPDEWQLMKALAVAVNEAIQEEKIEPVDKDSKQVNKELYDLLARDNRVSPQQYFRKKVTWPENLKITSPRVLAKFCLLAEVKEAQWVVESMIQRQFKIKWDTASGEPDDYSFYDFCDTKITEKLLKYIPRQAHVNATLYKEFCRKPKQRWYDKPKNVLCPDVFVKTDDGWKKWQAYDEEHNEEGKFKDDDLPRWIDEFILEFIKENADIQKPHRNSLKKSLEKPTLYWAVVKDSKFKPGEYLKLKEIGQTQVYVGKAKNGILGRWMKDSDSHCEMMKRCLDNVCAMTTYEPVLLKGIKLVDARLALAKVRGEKTALFVIKTFGDDLEKAEIAVQKAQRHFAAQLCVDYEASTECSSGESEEFSSFDTSQNLAPPGASANDDFDSDTSEESLPATSSERLRKAWDDLQSAKSFFKTLSKDSKTKKDKKDGEVKKQLEDEERYHRHGKRDKSLIPNIIPYDKLNMTWKPTLMGYGMNKF